MMWPALFTTAVSLACSPCLSVCLSLSRSDITTTTTKYHSPLLRTLPQLSHHLTAVYQKQYQSVASLPQSSQQTQHSRAICTVINSPLRS